MTRKYDTIEELIKSNNDFVIKTHEDPLDKPANVKVTEDDKNSPDAYKRIYR